MAKPNIITTLDKLVISQPESVFGASNAEITTARFIEFLETLGAFEKPGYWKTRGSWSYAANCIIADTDCGNIHLAGSVVEVFSDSAKRYTIRITTPTTGHGKNSAEFIYVNNGSSYSPGWRRLYSTSDKPSPAEIGAAAVNGNVSFNRLSLNDYGTPFECSQYIDLHKSGSTSDFDSRIYVDNNNKFRVISGGYDYDINGEITNLKSSVSNGKNAIAAAITSKGVASTGSDTFDQMATKIKSISAGGSQVNCSIATTIESDTYHTTPYHVYALWPIVHYAYNMNYIRIGASYIDIQRLKDDATDLDYTGTALTKDQLDRYNMIFYSNGEHAYGLEFATGIVYKMTGGFKYTASKAFGLTGTINRDCMSNAFYVNDNGYLCGIYRNSSNQICLLSVSPSLQVVHKVLLTSSTAYYYAATADNTYIYACVKNGSVTTLYKIRISDLATVASTATSVHISNTNGMGINDAKSVVYINHGYHVAAYSTSNLGRLWGVSISLGSGSNNTICCGPGDTVCAYHDTGYVILNGKNGAVVSTKKYAGTNYAHSTYPLKGKKLWLGTNTNSTCWKLIGFTGPGF